MKHCEQGFMPCPEKENSKKHFEEFMREQVPHNQIFKCIELQICDLQKEMTRCQLWRMLDCTCAVGELKSIISFSCSVRTVAKLDTYYNTYRLVTVPPQHRPLLQRSHTPRQREIQNNSAFVVVLFCVLYLFLVVCDRFLIYFLFAFCSQSFLFMFLYILSFYVSLLFLFLVIWHLFVVCVHFAHHSGYFASVFLFAFVFSCSV